MLTETFLNKINSDNVLTSLLVEKPDEKEFEWVQYLLSCFNKEHMITFEEKRLAHFAVKIDKRELYGFLPMSLKEFAVYIIYATLILYINPTIDVSVQYLELVMERMSKFDTQPTIAWMKNLVEVELASMTHNLNCGSSSAEEGC